MSIRPSRIHAAIRTPFVASLLSVMVMLALAAPSARAQCGSSIVARHGGETSAVQYVDANHMLVARGTAVDLMKWTDVNTPPTTLASAALDAPARKIAISFGSGRAFVLQDDGTITLLHIFISGQITSLARGPTRDTPDSTKYVDIHASDAQVFAVRSSESYNTMTSTWSAFSRLELLDFSGSAPTLISSYGPITASYVYDRLTRVGNRIWAGFHEVGGTLYGIEGIDFAVPASPQRTTASLNFVPLDDRTRVTAMTAIGTHVFMSYLNGSEDWMRAVDVTNPASAVWRAQVDLNGRAERIATIGNQLQVAVGDAGISVWSAANPAALAWLGTTDPQGTEIHDLVCVSGTNYAAAGDAGLYVLNSANPAAMTVRSITGGLPSRPAIVRQFGTRTAVYDAGYGYLRIYDYTLAPAFQSLGVAVVAEADFMELSIQPGGSYACLAEIGSAELQIVSLNNVASPSVIATFNPAPGRTTRQISTFGTRLYTLDDLNTLRIIDLINPASPTVRSTTTYGSSVHFTSMTSWANTIALGTGNLGLWFIDTLNAAAPAVRSVWNPGSDYAVLSLAKSPTHLYASSLALFPGAPYSTPQLEALDVSSIDNPARVWTLNAATGGTPSWADHLSYVGGASDKFLVGVDNAYGIASRVTVFDISNQAFPTQIETFDLWGVTGKVAAAASGARALCAGGSGDAGIYELTMPAQWRPVFVQPPQNQRVCLDHAVVLTLGTPAVSARPTTVTYQWYRGGTALVNGPTPWGSIISGADTPTLAITGARLGDAAYYRCSAANVCGAAYTTPRELVLCMADANCSGTVTIDDLFLFLNAWFSGLPSADVDGRNGVAIDDLFLFMNAWFQGCP